MQIHVIVGALSLCILGLGCFLGVSVRPLLLTAMKTNPVLIGPILTRMFNRYNLVALVFSGLTLALEALSTRSPARIVIATAMTLILMLKLPVDKLIAHREKAVQIRGVGSEGQRVELLHTAMEGATLLILLLAFGLFVLNLVPGSKS